MTNGMKPWKMGDFLSVKHGYPFQSVHFATEGHYVVVTPGNFYEAGGFKRVTGKEKYFTAQFPAEYLLKKGDLVVAMTQQTAGLLGSTAIIPADDEYLHNQRIGLISFDETVVDKLYLYYLFMTRSVRKQIEDSASGTKIKHTSPDKIYDIVVYLPDLDVQKHIGQLMWDIEQKFTNNSCISAELESMVKTLYDYWFVQFDFPDANGKPYRASGGEMVWNEQLKREIPKGWDVGKVDDLGTIVSGGTPMTTNEAYYTDNGIAWITPNDLSGNEQSMFVSHGERDITIEGLNNSSATLMPQNSVLFSSRAPIGYIAISTNEICTNQGFKSIVPNKGYGAYYIYYTIKRNTPAIAKQGVGTTFKEVSGDTLKKFKICLPTKELAKLFDKQLQAICERRKLLEEENIELSSLRDWLLPMLMNGQATVAPAEAAPKLYVLQPEKTVYDPRFDRWLQTQGVAARGTVDEQTLHDIFDAMDDDDKQ